ncbi:hypothetical protein CRG98_002492 [Punica granatum]|uniref:CG-1 domain-containing protein n=1 Tax=Punica granatum TaxID=22663 RepID=A0A2I0L8F9_PUNGR|nr:hypothetical protein CRG98_002492 [Punica granatum]
MESKSSRNPQLQALNPAPASRSLLKTEQFKSELNPVAAGGGFCPWRELSMSTAEGYSMNDLYREAQHRWLKPAEVLYILQNHEDDQIAQEPPQHPSGGSLYLFNKRVNRFFRRDGHNWRKKKDQRTVGEAHERLKVGNVETLNCYYAHGEQNPNFQRRSYWMLDPVYEHIVLVHYRDIAQGKSSSGSIASSSAFTPSPSPSPYSTQNPGSTSIISEVNESGQNLSSPGSAEVSSNIVFKNNVVNGLGRVCREEFSSPHNFEVSKALKRIEEQLSLNDNTIKELEPFIVEDEHSNLTGFLDYETEIPTKGQYENILDGPGYAVTYQFPNEHNGVQDNLSDYATLQDIDGTGGHAVGDEEGLWTEMLESYSKPSSFDWSKPQETQGYQWSDSTTKHASFDNIKIPAHPSEVEIPETSLEDYSHLFDQIPLGMLPESSSLTVAQVQKYSIKDISPQWSYSNEATKIIMVGSFLCDPSEFSWTCMFGDVEVPVEIVQEGVLCCEVPLRSPGKVTLCITSANREACSEIREFEYRAKSNICSQCKSSPSEGPGSTEEVLHLVRLVQMLLSDSPMQQGDSSLSGISLPKSKTDDDSCSHIIEGLLDGSGTSSEAINGLLQVLLKDKLRRWLSIRSQGNDQGICSLSKKEQGIIHTVAALGFEWTLNPILSCGVGIDFRDINGWTALHWAARFGREKMVAALIASGASAGAVTDPSACDPTGRTAASIAASSGHNGLAGYLSEVALTSHLSSLRLEESELSRGSAEVEAERTINSVTRDHISINEDQLSLKDTLTAVRNAAQAAARIQSAFRAHSFRKRQEKEAAAGMHDDYGISLDDFHAMSKLSSRSTRDYNSAALSIQKKYRGWKGRKDFLALRQKVVKIQAHVRGYQVRKQYKVFCWAVGVLDKVVLRWRRKGAGLRSLRHETEMSEESEDDEDILKVFRKQKVDKAVEEAVSRVLSMVYSPDARQQYRRVLERYRQAKADLNDTAGEAAPSNSSYTVDMENEEYINPFP